MSQLVYPLYPFLWLLRVRVDRTEDRYFHSEILFSMFPDARFPCRASHVSSALQQRMFSVRLPPLAPILHSLLPVHTSRYSISVLHHLHIVSSTCDHLLINFSSFLSIYLCRLLLLLLFSILFLRPSSAFWQALVIVSSIFFHFNRLSPHARHLNWSLSTSRSS